MTHALRLGAFTLSALAAAYAAIAIYAAFQFTHASRTPVARSPREIAELVEEVRFRASDGLALQGWYFPGTTERAAVLVHGKDSNRLDSDGLAFIARTLHDAGYAVLAFDLRGHGASEGDRFSLGHHERKDIAAAIDLVVSRGHPIGRIAVIGESMGASAAIQALRLRPGVGAVVADSAYADGPSIVDEAGPDATGLPGIFTPGIVWAARTLLGLDADSVDPERVVRDSPERPFLFIHCDADDLIRVHHARRLRAASVHPDSELWIVPGCGHVGASSQEPGEYARRLLAFLDARLRGS